MKSDIQVFDELRPRGAWWVDLDTRMKGEAMLAIVYSRFLGHGTDGHIRLMTIAHLVELLEGMEYELNNALRENEIYH